MNLIPWKREKPFVPYAERNREKSFYITFRKLPILRWEFALEVVFHPRRWGLHFRQTPSPDRGGKHDYELMVGVVTITYDEDGIPF